MIKPIFTLTNVAFYLCVTPSESSDSQLIAAAPCAHNIMLAVYSLEFDAAHSAPALLYRLQGQWEQKRGNHQVIQSSLSLKLEEAKTEAMFKTSAKIKNKNPEAQC